MINAFRRAALAAAALAAVTGTAVVSSAGSAQAWNMGLYESGLAEVHVTETEAFFWDFTAHAVCDGVTWDINTERQHQGRDLGVDTASCVSWMGECLSRYGSQAWLHIPADNKWWCTPPPS